MSTKIFASILLLLLTATCFAQDTIYMRNDQRIACTIIEVTSTEVNYKKLEISDGPLYKENKSLIAQIKYQNGFIDVFQEVRSPPVKEAKTTTDDYVRDPKNKNDRNEDYVKGPGKDKLIKITNNIYIYGNQRLNEKKMQQLLLSVNDPLITKEVRRAKLDKNLKYVGFLAIPFALGGAFFGAFINTYVGASSTTGSPTVHNQDFVAPALICTAGAAATFSASIYFGIDRKARNAKAMRLYQQKYE
jgi:hypothetical protein